MIRIFSFLSIFAIGMIFASSAGVFWLSLSDLETAKKESVTALAKGLSFNIAAQLQQQQKAIEQLAQHPDVVLALESNDTTLINYTAGKMETFLPLAMKLRILPADVSETDETVVPHFGYADLQMVQKTLTQTPNPIVQGQGENRHLAVTSAVKKDEQVIGVVLASLKFDFVNATLSKAPVGENFFEIKQGKVLLANNGDSGTKSGSGEQIGLGKSSWQIHYWSAGTYGFSEVTLMLAFVIATSLLICGAVALAYYQIGRLLKKDQTNVLQAVKDLMTGKGLGSYPVKLTEMKVIISTLVQFKRILDNKQSEESNSHQESPQAVINDGDMFNLDDITSEKASLKKKT